MNLLNGLYERTTLHNELIATVEGEKRQKAKMIITITPSQMAVGKKIMGFASLFMSFGLSLGLVSEVIQMPTVNIRKTIPLKNDPQVEIYTTQTLPYRLE